MFFSRWTAAPSGADEAAGKPTEDDPDRGALIGGAAGRKKSPILSQFSQTSLEQPPMNNSEEDELEMHIALEKIRQAAPIVISPTREDFDRLAILLRKSIKTSVNRRRLHAYADTFYGEAAIRWLVGLQIVQDVKDAKNALRHLVERRIIVRTDHTRPILDPLLQRMNPKFAESRRQSMVEKYQLGETDFHPEHLYRFNPSAFTTKRFVVNVVGATGLKYKTRLNVGGYLLSSKFRDRVLDPYVRVEFGDQSYSTSIVHSSADPIFDESFSLLIPDGMELVNESVWLRVFDFHEVLDDMELGFVCLPVSTIIAACQGGVTYQAKLPLAQSLELNDHAKVMGMLQFEIDHVSYKVPNPEWTVHEEARETEFEREKRNLSRMGLPAMADPLSSSPSPPGGGPFNVLPGTSAMFKAIDNMTKIGQAGDAKRQLLQLKLSKISTTILRFARQDSQLWIEFQIGDRVGLSPVVLVKDLPDFGEAIVPAIEPEEFLKGFLRVTLYQKYDFIKVKQGSGKLLLRRFSGQAPDHRWEIPLRRTAAFKRDIKRQVGTVSFQADIDVNKSDDLNNDDDSSGNEEELVIEVEDVLLSLLDAKASSTEVIAVDPFKNVIVSDVEVPCSLPRLLALICCIKSPVFDSFAKLRGFTETTMGEWKAGASPTPVPAASGKPEDKPADAAEEKTGQDNTAASGETSTTTPQKRLVAAASSSADETEVTPSAAPPAPAAAAAATAPSAARTSSTASVVPPMLRQVSLKLLESKAAGSLPELPTVPPVAVMSATSASPGTTGAETLPASESTTAGEGGSPEDSVPTRIVTFMMPASSLVKALLVTETHRLVKLSRTGFVLEIEGRTPDAPFGSSFSNHVQIFCSAVAEKRSRIRISCETHFTERPFLAGTIEGGSLQGAKDTYETYMRVLKKTIRGAGKKKDEVEEVEEAPSMQPSRFALGLAKIKPILPQIMLVLLAFLLGYAGSRLSVHVSWGNGIKDSVKDMVNNRGAKHHDDEL